MQQISIIGLGKAGLPLANVIADSSIKVIGYDINIGHVKKINSKINPIPEEKGLQELLEKNIPKKFLATSNLDEIKNSTVFIVIVPLFIDDNKKPDFTILNNAFRDVSKVLKKGDLVVLETTVPPKTTETLIKEILEKESGLKAGEEFYLAYSPERIMTGYSISRYKEFPKIVGGINDISTEKAFELYSKFCSKVEKVSNSRTAELIKVAEGVYRDVNIAIANELYKISDEIGVNFWEMREKANHQFCNIHEAGLGVGGHCIPVYPWFLINDYDAPLSKTARFVNDTMINFFVEKVKEKKATKVLIIGLSYREGVKETAYVRSIPLINKLKDEGLAVYGLDPLFDENETEKLFNIERSEDFKSFDLIILSNKNTEYLERLKEFKDKVIDVKNILK